MNVVPEIKKRQTCGSTGEADDSHVLRMWRLVGRVEQTSSAAASSVLPSGILLQVTHHWFLMMGLP